MNQLLPPTLEWKTKRKETAAAIRSRCPLQPHVGLVLGSGLGALAGEISAAVTIPYNEIPHFPISTVEGHSGELVLGRLEGIPVIAMNGRLHYYEGYSMQQLAFPIWVMRTLGAEILIATNAAGGVNRAFQPGDLMIITDHINWMFNNPLIGPNDPELGVRFPSMAQAYSWDLIELAQRAADAESIHVQRGVYIAVTGPAYTSRAESEIYRLLRADAVGMSTVPEVIAATHAGMRTLGISCITDVAKDPKAGTRGILTHEEVLEVANRSKPRFLALMRAILRELSKEYEA
ncbi:MAG: purine-nucleoside phosphorylase [Anaerolineae bacterium]|nr:purine-nucleoside phosphorylase [Anaerolineae bacterium]